MNVKSVAGRKVLSVSLLTSGLLFVVPSFAFAAEESGGAALLLPKMGEFIPMLVAFLVLWLILAKFGWPAIVGMLDKRTETIKNSLEKAEDARIESERLLEEHKAQMDEARRQAAEIIADAKKAGEVVKTEIAAKAHMEAEEMVARASVAIETEKKAAIAELQSSVADLSVSVAGRLIGQDLSDTDHRKIIERYVAEAGSLDAN